VRPPPRVLTGNMPSSAAAAPDKVVPSAAATVNAPAKRTRPSDADATSTKVPRLSVKVFKLLQLLPGAKAAGGRVGKEDADVHGKLNVTFDIASGVLTVSLLCGFGATGLVEAVFHALYRLCAESYEVSAVPNGELARGVDFLITVKGLWGNDRVARAFEGAREAFSAAAPRGTGAGVRDEDEIDDEEEAYEDVSRTVLGLLMHLPGSRAVDGCVRTHDTGPHGDLSVSFSPETRTMKACLMCDKDDDALAKVVFDGVYTPSGASHQVAVIPDVERKHGRVFLFTVQDMQDGVEVACAFERAREAFLADPSSDSSDVADDTEEDGDSDVANDTEEDGDSDDDE
jgi:hypothetical protein